jgi:tRNA G37 N-methylase Trm5
MILHIKNTVINHYNNFQKQTLMEKFKFIDLFAGIVGFHLAMHFLGGKCIFASEIDLNARKTYCCNFRIIG